MGNRQACRKLEFVLPATPDWVGFFGTWRSPVAHLHGVQGVVGSNPAVPTRKSKKADHRSAFWCFEEGQGIVRRRESSEPGGKSRRPDEKKLIEAVECDQVLRLDRLFY